MKFSRASMLPLVATLAGCPAPPDGAGPGYWKDNMAHSLREVEDDMANTTALLKCPDPVSREVVIQAANHLGVTNDIVDNGWNLVGNVDGASQIFRADKSVVARAPFILVPGKKVSLEICNERDRVGQVIGAQDLGE